MVSSQNFLPIKSIQLLIATHSSYSYVQLYTQLLYRYAFTISLVGTENTKSVCNTSVSFHFVDFRAKQWKLKHLTKISCHLTN